MENKVNNTENTTVKIDPTVETILAKVRKRAGMKVISNVPASADGKRGVWKPNSALELISLKEGAHNFLTGEVIIDDKPYTASLYVGDQGFTMVDVEELRQIPTELRNQIEFTLEFYYSTEKKRIYPNIVG